MPAVTGHPFPPSLPVHAIATHDRVVLPALPMRLPLDLRVDDAAGGRGARWESGRRRRGPRRRSEARRTGGVVVAKSVRGAGAAMGMTSAATAATSGKGGEGGEVGVVNSASSTRGITVTAARAPRPPLPPPDSSSPGIHVQTPVMTVPIPTAIVKVDPSSGPSTVTTMLSVVEFGSGFGCATLNTKNVAQTANTQGVVLRVIPLDIASELGSPPSITASPLIASIAALIIPAPVPSIHVIPRASTATGRFGLGLRWPALRGVVRSTSPRPSGGNPRDHPTGEGAVVGGGPRAEGTATMHLSVHVQRAYVPSRGRLAFSSPIAQPIGRVIPLLHTSAAVVVHCVPGGEGNRASP